MNEGPRDFVCRQCGKTGERSATAKFCFECAVARAKVRIAPAHRRSDIDVKPARHPGGGWACVDCGTPVEYVSQGRKCRPPCRCNPCREVRRLQLDVLSGRQLAATEVSRARRTGVLKPASDFACADCERPAEGYDHRDYNEPLQVDPVCRSCNSMRGHAKPFNPLIVSALLLAHLSQPV